MSVERTVGEGATVAVDGAQTAAFGVTQSLSGRAWRFQNVADEDVEALERRGLSPTLARVLAARGVAAEDLDGFLEPRLRAQLPDPSILANMDRAAERFASAVKSGETIAILGDYDVDGACSSALLLGFLKALGRKPLLYIPDRITEGYGPSPQAMAHLREQGAVLVVTVDCGAAAHQALSAAQDLGLDIVVLDHHAVEINPPAFAHVNPNGPDDRSDLTQLCAAGVVFLFLVAVQRNLRRQEWFAANQVPEVDLMRELDLVALATIADVVPLTGVNRAFVRQGLDRIARAERPGLAALTRLAAIEPPFTAYHLGFVFGPRINAGGRVGRCDLGARLLAGDDSNEAENLAVELERHNRERRAIEASILEAADSKAADQHREAFLFLAGDGWHPGVVGIVASRLKERHAKPALVVGFADASPDGVGRGSGRSVSGVDLGAIVRAARKLGILEAGGGHAMAAGFSVKRAHTDEFVAFVRTQIEPQRAQITGARDLIADAVVSPSGATLELIAELERAGPFGSGNPEPLFILPDVTLAYADIVGSDHLRLRLAGRGAEGLDAIAFRIADTPLGQGLLKARGRRLHVAGRLRQNDYGGRKRVQLHLVDAAIAET